MGTLENIKAKLPAFIVKNEVLNNLIGAIGNSVDLYMIDANNLKAAASIEGGSAILLDAVAADYGLVRHFRDTDKVMVIRLMNAIQTHQQRGSRTGLDNEGAEISMVTPYIQDMRFIIGVSAIGTGTALGGVGSQWTQFWNDTSEAEATIKAKVAKIVPLHVKEGFDYIDAYTDPASFEAIRGVDLLDGATFSITNDGFVNDGNMLIPTKTAPTYEFGNIDLGAGFATYQWLVDWIDYSAWDVAHDLDVQVRFSPDEAVWSSWTSYDRNQWVAGTEIDRYAQFKIALTMTAYRSLEHYIFRSFILKGLTAAQQRYGPTPPVLEIHPQIGN